MMNDGPDNLEDTRERLLYVISSLEDMGEIFTEVPDFDKSARYLLRIILGTVGISRGAIHIYPDQGNRLVLQAAAGVTDVPESLALPGAIAGKLAGDALPQPIDSLPRILREALSGFQKFWETNDIQVLLPLAVTSDFLGLVSLGPRFMKHGYDPDDLELLRLLSMHVSLYFKSRKLLAQAQRSNFELNRKILEMEQLFEVALSITRLDSRSRLTREILERATAILDARFGALWLGNTHGEFDITAAFGFDTGDLPDIMQDYRRISPGMHTADEFPYCMAVPIQTGKSMFGYLSVAGKEQRSGEFLRFSDSDRQLLSAFANQAAVALENADLHESAIEKERMDQELRVAAEIQETLLPHSLPRLDGYGIAASTNSCRAVGGDFFDVFLTPDHQLASIIADVSGKSTPAAMLVSTFHGALHAMLHCGVTPDHLAEDLNNLIAATTPDNKFITAFFLTLDPDTGYMRTVSAGHEPVFLIRGNGSVDILDTGGMVLGILPGITYQVQTSSLQPGDLLLLYTDGITDLKNPAGDTFDRDRLLAAARDYRREPVSTIHESIIRLQEEFRNGEPAPDDRTLVIIKRNFPS